jgi:hypothetical protein
MISCNQFQVHYYMPDYLLFIIGVKITWKISRSIICSRFYISSNICNYKFPFQTNRKWFNRYRLVGQTNGCTWHVHLETASQGVIHQGCKYTFWMPNDCGSMNYIAAFAGSVQSMPRIVHSRDSTLYWVRSNFSSFRNLSYLSRMGWE